MGNVEKKEPRWGNTEQNKRQIMLRKRNICSLTLTVVLNVDTCYVIRHCANCEHFSLHLLNIYIFKGDSHSTSKSVQRKTPLSLDPLKIQYVKMRLNK